jgi:branched-chain amino acid transport system permease protein
MAAILGYPGLRVKGVYFMILGIAFNELVRWVLISSTKIFGGISGIINIPQPDTIRIFSFLIDFNTSFVPFYYLALIILCIALFVYFRIHYSRLNSVWAAMNQNEDLLATTGISVFKHKIINLSISCFFAGLAGGVYAPFMSTIAPGQFGFAQGIYTFLAVLVGGVGTPLGPIIGVAFMSFISESLTRFKEYQPLVWGIILILVILFMRTGLVGLPGMIKSRMLRGNGS